MATNTERTPRKRNFPLKTTQLGIRISPEQLEEIRAKATEAGVSLTDYVIGTALGILIRPEEIRQEMKALERRIDRLEQLSGLNG